MEDAQKAQTKLVLCWCRKQKNGSKIDRGQKVAALLRNNSRRCPPTNCQSCHIRVRAGVFWAETWRSAFGFETVLIVRRQ